VLVDRGVESDVRHVDRMKVTLCSVVQIEGWKMLKAACWLYITCQLRQVAGACIQMKCAKCTAPVGPAPTTETPSRLGAVL